ncbi:hypothetical protein [Streptomyces sp. CNQ085]|uniref:hypothetical protein n=1 Tax=Streptomyces sp. CNQ085 TaxID=2886944 RepID=UPI001F511E06|nr:hypothetical protein [Streptomyces sp. CNQ085]MCI0385907.1 hypothetical protein [Streptomyces sp. CNQ085]
MPCADPVGTPHSVPSRLPWGWRPPSREVNREASAAGSVLSARTDADLTAVVTGTPSVRLIDAGQAITVGYVATSGNRTVRTLSGLDLGPPHLEAWCRLRDAERVLALSRVHSVMSAAPE